MTLLRRRRRRVVLQDTRLATRPRVDETIPDKSRSKGPRASRRIPSSRISKISKAANGSMVCGGVAKIDGKDFHATCVACGNVAIGREAGKNGIM